MLPGWISDDSAPDADQSVKDCAVVTPCCSYEVAGIREVVPRHRKLWAQGKLSWMYLPGLLLSVHIDSTAHGKHP